MKIKAISRFSESPFSLSGQPLETVLTIDNAPIQATDRFILTTASACIVDDVNIGDFRTEYAYDALGRRIEKRVGGEATRYVYDGARVAEEWSVPDGGSLSLAASYVYGLYVDEVLTMRRGGSDYYYHGDDMHNVVKLTDSDGDVVEGYDYADYGQPEFYDAAGDLLDVTASPLGNPFLFSGREWDPELGFYYYRNRYMDPGLGRFVSRDPLGLWGDPLNLGNGYAYAASNPWSLVDPFGLEAGGNSGSEGLGLDGTDILGAIDGAGANLTWLSHLRNSYNEEDKLIAQMAQEMLDLGAPSESVAQWAVNARNLTKDAIRRTDPFKKVWELRNMEKYKNPLGPSYENFKEAGLTDKKILQKIIETNPKVNAFARASKIAGPASVALGAGLSGYEIYQAAPEQRIRVATVEGAAFAGSAAGAWGGAWAGAWAGGLAGGAVGGCFAGVGAIAGAPIGAFIGGVGGLICGSFAGDSGGRALAGAAWDQFE